MFVSVRPRLTMNVNGHINICSISQHIVHIMRRTYIQTHARTYAFTFLGYIVFSYSLLIATSTTFYLLRFENVQLMFVLAGYTTLATTLKDVILGWLVFCKEKRLPIFYCCCFCTLLSHVALVGVAAVLCVDLLNKVSVCACFVLLFHLFSKIRESNFM